ncbi:MAG: helix-hairpin-helix domain-containing protein [Candidatus Dormibacteria bacterium]
MGEFLESSRGRALATAAALLLLAAAAALAFRLATSAPAGESFAAEAARARGTVAGTAPDPAGADTAAPKATMLTVYVSGEVANPGLYRLPRGARVADAIDAAGGLLPTADSSRLPNLAGRLTDGKQVRVPRAGRGNGATSTRLDINSASLAELMTVPGMSEATAGAIVEQRDAYGPFTALAELHTQLGLDAQVVAALRPFLKVGTP